MPEWWGDRWSSGQNDSSGWKEHDSGYAASSNSHSNGATNGWSNGRHNDQPAVASGHRWSSGDNSRRNQWGYKRDNGNKNDSDIFWGAQKHNKDKQVLSRKEEEELEKEDEGLFQQRLGDNAGMDFDMYDQVLVTISGSKADMIPVCQTFEEMFAEFEDCIPEVLMTNIRKCKFNRPTPVQKYAVPAGLVGRDIMCCAQTGSGKTAAYIIPVCGRMMKNHLNPIGDLLEPFEGECDPDTVILAPTRELVMQIYEEALKFCHRTKYRVVRLYGGAPAKDQLAEIALGADLMVATPGRLTDFLHRAVVRVDRVFVVVLDEADRMLDMGFEPQIREIIDKHGMPAKENRQTMMFSATFAETCQRMAQDYLFDYVWVGVGVVGGAVESVEQKLLQVTPKSKYEKLIEILDGFFENRTAQERCLVFTNAKDTARWLDEQLFEKNYDTGALHGDLEQKERELNLQRFRSGEIEVMIATDVAARGLDIEKVSLVINYDMPIEIDSYIHRIGRTGRIGNKGTAITLVSCNERSGEPLEQLDVLKKLLRVMRDAKSEIPKWLQPLIDNAAAKWVEKTDKWKWGGKDMRNHKDWGGYSNGNKGANKNYASSHSRGGRNAIETIQNRTNTESPGILPPGLLTPAPSADPSGNPVEHSSEEQAVAASDEQDTSVAEDPAGVDLNPDVIAEKSEEVLKEYKDDANEGTVPDDAVNV